MLVEAMVALTEHPDLSRETVRRRLAKNELRPWQRQMRCIPKVDGTLVALYAEPLDPVRPVVCFKESPVQLV